MKMKITTYDGKNYIMDECIGKGGMSKVYAGRSVADGRAVAVKMLTDSKRGDALFEAKRQLLGEMRILEALKDKGVKGVPRLLGKGDSFYVMEYIKGRTFGKKELDAKKTIELGTALCDILTSLHEGFPRVLYLDLKPSNVMLGQSGEICLIDFGTARILSGYNDGDVADSANGAGTKGYAAPEQYGGFVSESMQTDIYLLGRTLDAVLKEDCRDGFILDELKKVIERCTDARKSARYCSCREVKAAILSCEKNAAKRKRFIAAGLIVGFILFVLSAVFILMFFIGEISAIYGIISVLLGRLIWNSDRIMGEAGILFGKKSEDGKMPEKPCLFLDIVKTCDTIDF